MKKTTLAIVCLLGCTALSLSAQEAEKKQLHEIKVKFDKVPDGLPTTIVATTTTMARKSIICVTT